MTLRMLLKIGGRAFEAEDGFRDLAEALKSHPDTQVIIVHGGGKEISNALKAARRPTVFIDGIRVTQAEDMEIVEAVLSETVNRRIASRLEASGIPCRRMSGKTGGLFRVKPLKRQGKAFGYVGEIHQVNAGGVSDALEQGQVPVISPISADENGESYNVNADTAAAALAVATQCTDLVYLTDVPGVCVGNQTCESLSVREARQMIADGIIAGGMVAKMESAFEAINGEVPRVHITCWDGPQTFDRLRDPLSGTGTVLKK